VSGQYDKDATTEEGIFEEARDRLKIAESAESDNRIEGLKALAFVDGEQWDSGVARIRTIDARPALTINHTNTFCRRIENTLKQQRPRIKCHPTKDSTIDTAKVVNGLIRHIETISNASIAYDAGGTSAINIGWGYWRIGSEYLYDAGDKTAGFNDQELKILPVFNPFTVYMDPNAVMPAGEDQQWCIISTVISRREYKRLYPKAPNTEWSADAPGDMTQDWESKEQLRLGEYFRIHEVADKLYQMEDGSTRLASEMAPDFVYEAMGNGVARDKKGREICRPTTRRQVEWYRLNGRQVVEKKILAGRYIPVIRCQGNTLDVNGRIKRKGMVKDLMDPARMYNYWRTAQTEEIALAPKAPWVAFEGTIDGHDEWHTANTKSYSVLVAKAVKGPNGELLPLPQRQQPAQVSAGFSEAAQGAASDLMSVAGMPQEDPQIAARVVSGDKHLQRRQGMADLTHWHFYDNQTYSIMFTGIILLDLIPYYYDTKRIQRIIGDDGIPQMVTINDEQPSPDNPAVMIVKNDMTVGRYDVVMDTSGDYLTKRQESSDRMMQLLETPLGDVVVKTGSDVVLRNFDFDGADILADRAMVTNPEAMDKAIEGLPDQAKNIIGALKQQVDQAQEQIQHLTMELKYKSGIEQMKDTGQTRRTLIQTTGKAHDTETKAATDDKNSTRDFKGWMHEVDVTRQTQLDVAEIKVGGELLNTHAEAMHEKSAAKAAIQAGADIRPTNGSN
jgi:hypothetical protein